MVKILILTVFPALMAFAAASDLFTMKISNWVQIALVAGFATLALATGMELSAVGIHLVTGLGVLVLGFAMFSFGWVGGGDAKLMAATALWFGASITLLIYVVYAGFIGGLLTMALLTFRQFPLPAPVMAQGWISRLHNAGSGVPYGIALAAAGLIAYGQSPWIAAAGG